MRIGGTAGGEETNDHDRLRTALEAERSNETAPLWLVLIGHGTFDGRQAKFNLRGPDVSADELAPWLEKINRPLAIINCSSSSAPFINALSAPSRVIVTATKSGFELNFSRFGKFISQAIADPAADLDKDSQTSLLEAYLAASRQVGDFYKSEGRLATEHALLDDNGDGLGTPGEWFRGVRAIQKPRSDAAPDGVRAHQFHLAPSRRERNMPAEAIARRDLLEQAVALLRDRKAQLPEAEYYHRLEPLLVELAELYERADSKQ